MKVTGRYCNKLCAVLGGFHSTTLQGSFSIGYPVQTATTFSRYRLPFEAKFVPLRRSKTGLTVFRILPPTEASKGRTVVCDALNESAAYNTTDNLTSGKLVRPIDSRREISISLFIFLVWKHGVPHPVRS